VRTLILQSISAILLLALGVVCWIVSRRPHARSESHALAWRLSGVALLMNGIHVTIHGTLAVWAYLAGAGSPVYERYLEWMPVGGYSRTVLMLVFALLLTVLVTVPVRVGRQVVRFAPVALLTGLLIGGVLGRWEGRFLELQHYSRVSVLDASELLLVLIALFAALLMDGMSRDLWFALGVYAFNLSLTVIWTAALAATRIGWAPSPWQMAGYRCVLMGAAVLLAWRGLRHPERSGLGFSLERPVRTFGG
jgi:hypothetical protein